MILPGLTEKQAEINEMSTGYRIIAELQFYN